MAEKKVTTMVIKVDLQCEKCRMKIKKLLCKIPQIQNQEYDKKTGTVIITVVCCSPEKIKKKICCEGGETVQSIDIKVPEKPKAQGKPEERENSKEQEKPKAKGKPKERENSKEKEKPEEHKESENTEQPKLPTPEKAPEPVQEHPPVLVYPRTCCNECYQGFGGGPCYHDHGRQAPPSCEPNRRPAPPNPAPPQKTHELLPRRLPVPVYPRTCCNECYQGLGGGPCYHDHGRPAPSSYEPCGKPASPQPAPPPRAFEPVPGHPPVPVFPRTCCNECYQGFGGGPCYNDHGRPAPQTPAPKAPGPVPAHPLVPVSPRTCCNECYQGFGGGPCYHDHGSQEPPTCEPYGRPIYDSWGGGGCNCQRSGYYVCRCEYVGEDNPSSCTIM